MGYKVFVSFEGVFIVRRWGSSDEVVGGFWDTHRFWVIPLGPVKLPSQGFLSFVTSGLSNLQRGISFVFQGYYRLPCKIRENSNFLKKGKIVISVKKNPKFF